ncbi:MAG: methyltransferase domain-containing protein [Gammaproteobacteria bacterium]|nr:methyltransferase domain-containing protein [Gammaproteobacteria bacterium]
MPDIFARITDADADLLAPIVDTLEKRAADPQLRAMLDAYLAEIELPQAAEILEVGSGTGPIARVISGLPQAARVVGLDPSPVFLAKARELSGGLDNLSFVEGNGGSIPYPDGSFDAVVFHTLLCHVPDPAPVVTEAMRVLRPGGTLAVFDCDFSTASLSTGDFDPFAAIVQVMLENIVHDRWFVRNMSKLLRSCGLHVRPMRSYSYVEHPEPSFMFSWIERGTDALLAEGRIGDAGAQALRLEGQRRVEDKEWFAHIVYASIIATK